MLGLEQLCTAVDLRIFLALQLWKVAQKHIETNPSDDSSAAECTLRCGGNESKTCQR